jgi:hypothetical protein
MRDETVTNTFWRLQLLDPDGPEEGTIASYLVEAVRHLFCNTI